MSSKGSLKRRVLQMVEVGYADDFLGRLYDYINMTAVVTNLIACIFFTFDRIVLRYGNFLNTIELVTVTFFLVDYVLRVWTADYLYPDKPRFIAIIKYIVSFAGIIDFLSFVPYFLPVFFPTGSVAFRMIRVARIFRIFRINAYYDSLNVITAVLKSKRQQLLSSGFILFILMMASSLCMYSVENAAQPEVFSNAFSGIWWATSTLLTVGYGDIYPITIAGKVLGIIITFLGVGVVAIPTGIISAGFVEQYSRIREMSDSASETALHFITVTIRPKDPWSGKKIMELALPKDMIVAVVQRKNEVIVPRGDVLLLEGDTIVLGAKTFHDDFDITLQEMVIKELNPWNGMFIKDLDISRQTFIITVKRGNHTIVPRGDFKIKSGDTLLMYSKKKIVDSTKISL